MSPERRRLCVTVVGECLGISQRRACRPLGQHRSVQRRKVKVNRDEAALTSAIIALAIRYGRYGYRRITALLKCRGWRVNSKRVQRIGRQEGLKVPSKQPKRGRLWLNDGSCIRLRPEHKNHVWAYDFVSDRTANGKAFRMLTVVDEYTRESLAIRVERNLNSTHVLAVLLSYSSNEGRQHISARIMVRSFVLKLSSVGLNAWTSTRSLSNRAAPGRTAMSNPLTASLETNSLMTKSSRP